MAGEETGEVEVTAVTREAEVKEVTKEVTEAQTAAAVVVGTPAAVWVAVAAGGNPVVGEARVAPRAARAAGARAAARECIETLGVRLVWRHWIED